MDNSDNGSLGTPLALSDIIHTLSPSPAPQVPSDIRVQELAPWQSFSSEDQNSSQDTTLTLTGEGDDGQAPKSTVSRRKPLLLERTITAAAAAAVEEEAGAATTTSPEPITEEDVSNYRARLVEMGLSTNGMNKKSDGLNTNSREEELLDMVLSLTRSPFIASSQLVAQAEMIASLQMWQEHMVSEMEEERARWEVERNGWERMAEALIAQRNKPGSGATPNEELERKCSVYESDNRILRDRLQEIHSRANALEAEVAKLKPMLLMMPLSNASPSNASSVAGGGKSSGKGKKRKQSAPGADHDVVMEDPLSSRPFVPRTVHMEQSTSSVASTSTMVLPTAAASNAAPSTSTPSESYRYPYSYAYPYSLMSQPSTSTSGSPSKNSNPYLSYAISTRINGQSKQASSTQQPTASSSSNTSTTTRPLTAYLSGNSSNMSDKQKRRFAELSGATPTTAVFTTLSADARTEHILLACRKIGRERAAALAGVMQITQKERERWTKEHEEGRAAKESERLEKERLERVKSAGGGSGVYYRSVGDGGGGTSSNSNSYGNARPVAGGSREEGPSTPRRGVQASGSMSAVSSQQQQPHPQKGSRQPTFVYVKTPGQQNSAAAPITAAGSASTIATGGSSANLDLASLSLLSQQSVVSVATPPQANAAEIVATVNDRTPRQQQHILPQTPHHHQQQQHGGVQSGGGGGAGPTPGQTPLDSLLSAARSMMRDSPEDGEQEQSGSKTGTGGRANGNGKRKGAAALDDLESPVPKRRRMSTIGGSKKVVMPSARIPSALDVLADQAQVAAALQPSTSTASSISSSRVVVNTQTQQVSNARAEAMTRTNTTASASSSHLVREDEERGEEEDVGMVTRRRSMRGRGRGISKGKGKEKAADVDVDVDVQEVVEVELVERDAEPDPPPAMAPTPTPPPPLPSPPLPSPPPPVPERRKRGRPRKDKSLAVSGPVVPVQADIVKEENVSAGLRRRTPRNNSLAASASASTSGVRTRGMGEGASSVRDPATASRRGRGRGRGAGKSKGANVAATATTSTVSAPVALRAATPPVPPLQPQPHSLVPSSSAPRIIAPPLSPLSGDPTANPILGGVVEGAVEVVPPGGGQETNREGDDASLLRDRRRRLIGVGKEVGEGDYDGDSGDGDLESRQLRERSAEEGEGKVGNGVVGPSGGGEVGEGLGSVKMLDEPGMNGGSAPEEEVDGRPAAEPEDVRMGVEDDGTMLVEESIVDPLNQVSRDQHIDTDVVMEAPTNPASPPTLQGHGLSLDSEALPILEETLIIAESSPEPNGVFQDSGPSLTIASVTQSLEEPSLTVGPWSSANHSPGPNSEPSLSGIVESVGSSSSPAASNYRPATQLKLLSSVDDNPRAPFGSSPPLTVPVATDKLSLTSRNNVESTLNGIISKADAGHDSELDGEAEVDPEHDDEMDAEADEDLDAEGEDEDDREGDGPASAWSQVAFSSSDISKLLQPTQQGGVDDDVDEDDVDAEGEIEDESDGPPAAVFRPPHPATS